MGYTSRSPETGDTKTGGAAGQKFPLSSSTDEPWTEMEYIDLAITVLKTQDPYLIHSLIAIINPAHIIEYRKSLYTLDDYLLKPVNIDQLMPRIESYLSDPYRLCPSVH